MRGKLAVVIALLVAAPAAADEPHRDITLDPGKTLMEVKVPGTVYDELYGLYRSLYPATAEIVHALAAGPGGVRAAGRR